MSCQSLTLSSTKEAKGKRKTHLAKSHLHVRTQVWWYFKAQKRGRFFLPVTKSDHWHSLKMGQQEKSRTHAIRSWFYKIEAPKIKREPHTILRVGLLKHRQLCKIMTIQKGMMECYWAGSGPGASSLCSTSPPRADTRPLRKSCMICYQRRRVRQYLYGKL